MNCKNCGRLTSTATSNNDGNEVISCHVAVDNGVWVEGCAWNEKPEQLSDMYKEIVKSKMAFPKGF